MQCGSPYRQVLSALAESRQGKHKTTPIAIISRLVCHSSHSISYISVMLHARCLFNTDVCGSDTLSPHAIIVAAFLSERDGLFV